MNKHQSKLDEIWSKNKALLKQLSAEMHDDEDEDEIQEN